MSKEKKICIVEGCERERSPKAGKGMCSTCYSRYRRHGDPSLSKQYNTTPVECKIDDCHHKSRSAGYCVKHYSAFKRNGFIPTEDRRKTRKKNICKIENCHNSAYGGGYCNNHWYSLKKYGDPLYIDNHRNDPREPCKIEGCLQERHTNGYCRMHWRRLLSTGDFNKTKIEKHGMTDSSEYHTWQGMKARCTNTNNDAYDNYGGRGIAVCDRWLEGFSNFYEDMGSKPFPEAEIDRIDNDGNYEPGNCRWVTRSINARNRRMSVVNQEIANEMRERYKKENIKIIDLSKEYNVHRSVVGSIVNNKTWVEKP